MRTREDLRMCFETAIKEAYCFIGIKIKYYGYKDHEVVIVTKNNFPRKFDYYMCAYDEDLYLKNMPVQIVDFAYGNDCSDITRSLF